MDDVMENVFLEAEISGRPSQGAPRLLAHSYTPWQFYKKAFSPAEALERGTLFPELFGVYRIPK